MIRLDARLRAAFDLLQGVKAVADIGCDHGKLAAALLLEGGCKRVVAGDISPDCLNKARRLLEERGLSDRAQVRLGSGLSILLPEECDAGAILGMGGELIAELLAASEDVAAQMERLVLQPMSGIEELRQWLYENRFCVLADRLVTEKRRTYQILCVRKAKARDPWPQGFPEGCFLVGYRAFLDREPGLFAYCQAQLHKRADRLKQARGTGGEEKLQREIEQLQTILEEIEAWN